MSYNQDKSMFRYGIALIVIGVFVLLAGAWGVLHIANNARKYPTAVTGTVIQSSVYQSKNHIDHHGTSPYSDITVAYDGLNGSKQTIEFDNEYGAYRVGETVALRCTEGRDAAVLEQDTHQNPIFISCVSCIGLFFGLVGVILVKKYKLH